MAIPFSGLPAPDFLMLCVPFWKFGDARRTSRHRRIGGGKRQEDYSPCFTVRLFRLFRIFRLLGEKCYPEENDKKIYLAMLKQKASPESVLPPEQEQESIAQLQQILSRESGSSVLVVLKC